MPRKMTIFRIGIKLVAFTFLYFILVVVLDIKFPIMIFRAFKKHHLLTTGPYAVFQNPMYASFILCIIPGISLLLSSWLVLTTSVVLYVIMKLLIKGESKYLADEFGEQYLEYQKKVWCKFL
jgi:protein-S-isoprenylcysteine O-methyltransferase Ste14